MPDANAASLHPLRRIGSSIGLSPGDLGASPEIAPTPTLRMNRAGNRRRQFDPDYLP